MIDRTIRELTHLIQSGTIKVADLANQYLTEIGQHNNQFRAVSMISETGVRMLAEAADQAIESNESLGPLHGIPILIDDLIDVANMRSTYGCMAYSENIPEADSMSVRRLRAAGALILGKTTTTEVGLLVEEDEQNFICRSPWGDRFVSGGGSSGASVGLVKNFAAASVVMDVGGNGLLPAVFSGVFALRPTYGRIPHTPIYSRGLMFASAALVTRDATDCAILMNVVCGHSEVDPLSLRMPNPDYESVIMRSIRGVSIAIAYSLWNAPFDDDHRKIIDTIEKVLRSARCRVERKRPPIRNTLIGWETVSAANLFAVHGDKFVKRPECFGEAATQWIKRGETISSLEYIDAQKQIYGMRLLLEEFFQSYDLLIVSAAGCSPFEYGEIPANLQERSQSTTWQEYASMCNIGATSGFPTAHLPVGSNKSGLPIGVFVIAKPGHEDLLLALCLALESGLQ